LKYAVKNGIKIPEALSALSHLHGLAIFAKYPSGACRLKIKMRLKSILAFAPYCKNLRTVFICLSSHYPEKVLDNSLSGYTSVLSLVGRKDEDKGFVEEAMNVKGVIDSTIQVEREKLKDNRLETLEIKIMVHVSILEGRRICAFRILVNFRYLFLIRLSLGLGLVAWTPGAELLHLPTSLSSLASTILPRNDRHRPMPQEVK
jgi:hypothetical protein